MADKTTNYFHRLSQDDPAAMRAIGAQGGLTMVARHGRDFNTSKARAAKQAKMLAEVDPTGTLPPEEVQTRLAALVRAHSLKMVEAKRRARIARAQLTA